MNTYADLKVGDGMCCPTTGYSGAVLSISKTDQSNIGQPDLLELDIEGCGPLFMLVTDEVQIF